jgi:hypothetical protein
MASKKTDVAERAVLVTTEHRGIFFGYLIGDITKEQVKLRAVRNVVYFDTATKGFIGLASEGPTAACRVGPPAGDESTLFDITGVFAVTERAAKRFEDAPWAR